MADPAGPAVRRSVAAALAVALGAGLLAVSVGTGTAAAADAGPASTVRIEAVDDAHLILNERARYAGALELSATAPAIVVNELAIDDYVAGVDEMPSRWHGEALMAQAIAARTYAWHSMRLDSFTGYDICATTSCQVYRGVGSIEDGDGGRWFEAVQRTAGQVLLDDDGGPILARYFSTSGGRTVANEVAFPNSGPRPYLVGTDDPYDEVSPYHRWTARFTRDEFDTLLARGDTLSAASPVASIERVGDVDDPGASVRVTGQDGAEVEVGARELREFLSRMAPDSFPDRFPGARSDGLGRLPTTVPSSRFDPQLDDDEVVLHGQGWGHAVGLGQYGALGRAQDGQDHREILAAYYAGLEPTTSPDLPDRIRVGLEVTGPHEIRGTGATRLLVDDEVVAERAIGTWTFEHDGAGWRSTAPDGHDEPLEVSETRVGNTTVSMADTVTIEVDVNKPVLLRLEVSDPDGGTVADRDLGAHDAGTHAATWRSVGPGGEALPPGEYRVALTAEDAAGASGGSPVAVTVGDDGQGAGATSPADREAREVPTIPIVVTVAAAALMIALVTLAVTIRRRP